MSRRTTVKFGPYEIALGVPASMTVRWEIAALANTNELRAGAAALGACWQAGPSGRKPRASYRKCKHDPAVYGQQVLDELLARDGVTFTDVMGAATVAIGVLTDGLFSEEDVASAEDFSDPGEAASTGSSSTSSESSG